MARRDVSRPAGDAALDPEGAVQAWIFQQFLVLLVLTPVAGSMSVAAYSVIGEKQARTLEPLLATPITTFELLAAKVLGVAAAGARADVSSASALYVGGVALLARPGVFAMLLTPRSLAVISPRRRWPRWRRCSWRCACRRASTTRAAPSRSAR